LLLTACQPPALRGSRAAQQIDAGATQAAYAVQTAIVRASDTPTATVAPTASATPITLESAATATPTTGDAAGTPSPGEVRVTAAPGLQFYTNPDVAQYVFQIDPALWQKDPGGETSNLVHQSLSDCRIEAVPGHGLGPPERLTWEDHGRFRWEVMDYGKHAFVFPILGGGLNGADGSFLDLVGYNQPGCRSDQMDVLDHLMTSDEAGGAAVYAPFASPTPRPALEGYDCPNTVAARLRVGDEIQVVTDGLWLRSAPQADEGSKVRKYSRGAPQSMRVIGGPQCGKYTYWQVEISDFGEGNATTTQGWFAEGDASEYYLAPVR
jgi:hypothetical protein